VQPFDGDLDDYQKWLLEVSRAAARGQPAPEPPRAAAPAAPAPEARPASRPSAPAPAPAPKPETRESRQLAKQARAKQSERTRPLRMELQRIDERLARLGTEKTEIEAALAAPDGDYAELGRRLAHVGAEVAMLEERWLELHTELEGLGTGS